jgi:hypothetical protein
LNSVLCALLFPLIKFCIFTQKLLQNGKFKQTIALPVLLEG